MSSSGARFARGAERPLQKSLRGPIVREPSLGQLVGGADGGVVESGKGSQTDSNVGIAVGPRIASGMRIISDC